MLVLPEEAGVLEKLVAWGEAHASISALILTSSRAKPDGRADVLSDYGYVEPVSLLPARGAGEVEQEESPRA
jgi:hypothetical protein